MHNAISGNSSAPKMGLRAVLDDCRRRRAQGEVIADDAIIADHPELMPELGDELRKLRIISAAGAQVAVPHLTDGDGTIDHTPTRKHSRGLHIRCPHCSNFVEVVTDTPYEEISCSTCGSTFSLVDRDEATRIAAPLKSIGRFDLVTRLGVGGFGTVWKAHDRELDRTVAVKIPRRGQLSPTEIDQFFREARAAAQLRHTNIVPVHEVGRDGETLFIVSDLVRGVVLSDWMTADRKTPREVAQLCIPVADALHHAHENGIVHRDLKPSNILIDEHGQPHLTDFGLAKREVGEVTMTVDGQILGTPGYMSPEQASGQGHWTDRRTDIYSFGVVVFQLLTGELPFRGNAQMQIHRRLTEDPPDPRTLNRHLPADLCTICLKCLERDPNRRYSNANELTEELRRFDRGEPILSRPISRVERTLRWAKRNPAITAAAALTAILAIAGPITALVIELQRQRLGELIAEKDNLIEQNAIGKEKDANEISELRGELEIWNGHANPWTIWPANPALPPRKMLMQRVKQQSGGLATALQQADADEQKAFGMLALAIMDDELGRTKDAIKHYQAAREVLTELSAHEPEATQYAAALADCSLQLSRLRADDDRDVAKQDIDQARTVQRKLAAQNSDRRTDAEWLETELRSATFAGFAGAKEHLDRAREISKQFEQDVPTDPVELYRLICHLGGREPILASRRLNADSR